MYFDSLINQNSLIESFISNDMSFSLGSSLEAYKDFLVLKYEDFSNDLQVDKFNELKSYISGDLSRIPYLINV